LGPPRWQSAGQWSAVLRGGLETLLIAVLALGPSGSSVRRAGRGGARLVASGGVSAAGWVLSVAVQLVCKVLVWHAYPGNFTLRRGAG
jgi:hypothetical protein